MHEGNKMYGWAKDLYPICRSISGNGVRETLAYLKKLLPELQICEIPSGTQVFDWTVPDEWNINDAFVADESGKRIIDFRKHNLHVLGHSEPIDTFMTFVELDKYLYSIPSQPNAIPYITSYYERRWGFCVTDNLKNELRKNPQKKYHVKIDSTLKKGIMNYGELIIPGKTKKEILLSTYVCHPSMANNELSGPCVTAALSQWINNLKDRRYTYRIVFLVETIGSIVYLNKHIKKLKQNVEAGFVLTCVGDDRTYSYVPSKYGKSLSDRIAKHVLKYHYEDYKAYSFLDRGSDERQYCSPGIELPICSICRSKYGEYPEYHTSLDDLSLISPKGLQGSLDVYKKCITLLEKNKVYRCTVTCEPQLGKRGLYPTLSTRDSGNQVRNIMNLITYSDGRNDIIDIADLINVNAMNMLDDVKKLVDHALLEEVLKIPTTESDQTK